MRRITTALVDQYPFRGVIMMSVPVSGACTTRPEPMYMLEHLRALSPTRFEELCALYLRVLGCEDVKVVGAATAGSLGDGGMDVTGTLAQVGLPAVRLAVQAKRLTGGVGPNVVTQLRGSIPPGTYGIVITTGHFTRAAIAEASRADRNAVKLVDGPELAPVLAEKGIGVKNTMISIPRLDTGALTERLEAGQW
jgi:restriction system protein